MAEVAEGGAQQIEDRRSDMINDKECNHAEAIAREMHMYYAAQAHNESNTPIPHWADLTENDQQGWIAVANTALPIIGKHALEDVRAYLGIKAAGKSSWWEKALYAAGAVIAGAILGGLGMSLSGCGHSVNVTPDRAEVCKDGACLVLEPGRVSFSQVQPVSDVSPVVKQDK
ncbi:hypothetical protein [Akkermansia muciniphila]|uniref:hypothetical protein n=2 Tax=Akkermansia muciniphila TaxID=239935 RepID=UPI001BFF53C4|nr:hypothetical protein [Akkermansia muciniphila]